jgi:hypothetical protein
MARAASHLELAGGPVGETPPALTEEDLPVLYLGAPADDALIQRLVHTGRQVVSARSPPGERWESLSPTLTATGSYSVTGHGSEQHRLRQADADPATQSASLSGNRTRKTEQDDRRAHHSHEIVSTQDTYSAGRTLVAGEPAA